MTVISNFADTIRRRHTLGVQRRQTEFALQLAEQDRQRQVRDHNFGLAETDRTYLLPYARRGIGSSGYAQTADTRYRQGVQYQRADIEQAYLNARANALMGLAGAEQGAQVEAMLGNAALNQSMNDANLQAILNALGIK